MTKVLLPFLLLLISAHLIFSLVSSDVAAEEPFPSPAPIDCSDVGSMDRDFHSLRPFQASPCNPLPENTTLYCGNDVIAIQHVGENGEFRPSTAIEPCTPTSDGQICKFEYTGVLDVSIDLSNAELPIAGNTELVDGGQNYTNQLDDAQRVNEYVSWYLNGTAYRPEDPPLAYKKISDKVSTEDIYDFFKSKNHANPLVALNQALDAGEMIHDALSKQLTDESHEKVTAYTGPLNKLLPQRIQFDRKEKSIMDAHSAQSGETYLTNPDVRHNQIVGCVTKVAVPIFDISTPSPCYDPGIISIIGTILNISDLRRIRLDDYSRNNPINIFNAEKLPPKEEEYHAKFISYADSFTRYYEDYKEWRGGMCFKIGIPYIKDPKTKNDLLIMFCAENPTKPNYWANFFPYIPYSTTEDAVGGVEADVTFTTQPRIDDVEITDIEFTPTTNTTKSDNLYFSHMKENSQLAYELQQTYLPYEYKEDGWSKNPQSRGLYDTSRCNIENARSNPGDDLFGEFDPDPQAPNPEDTISGDVDYTATFTCTFTNPDYKEEEMRECHDDAVPGCSAISGGDPDLFNSCMFDADNQCRISISGGEIDTQKYLECRNWPTQPSDITCYDYAWSPYCEKDINLALSVYTKTPYAQELWERTVEGEQSIYKRMFPKAYLEITEILDLSAATQASYLSSQATQVNAGTGSRSGSNAQIFIPHLGGIQEYFLKNLQKALRPESFGGFVTTGTTRSPNLQCILDESAIQSDALKAMIADAGRWAHVPVEVLIAVTRGEGCGGGNRTTNICLLSDAEVLQYSQPGAEYPVNCSGGGNPEDMDGKAKGPYQFYHSEGNWGVWAGAVNIATGDNRVPNVCNIKDSLYAAAWALSAGHHACPVRGYDVSNTPPASSWSLDDMKVSLSHWASGCSYGVCEHAFAGWYCSFVEEIVNSTTTNCN